MEAAVPSNTAAEAAIATNGDGAGSLPDRSKQPKPKKEKAPKQSKPLATSKPPSKAKPKFGNAPELSAPIDPDAMFKVGFLADVYQERPKSSEGIQKIVTRFPPEPNGFLHIGHAKAIAINFGFAKYHGGECYLRLDDTNPEEEENVFETSIIDTAKWLGFIPKAVTYSSDHFDRLYKLAESLVEKGGAYVCHCTKKQIVDQRGGGEGKKPRYACPHRERSIEENLSQFRAMRDGKYKPNEASLRMKQDLSSGNPQMWDLVAYRIPAKKNISKETSEDDEGMAQNGAEDSKEGKADQMEYAKAHYRTGDKWKIYPSYDFCHCLCDSFEGITHSLCTVEFELSRVSYEWLNNRLADFKPMQREYGRLSVSGTVLSKRKIKELIVQGHVTGYDDPRLYTLPALRRRGIPPGAILAFVNELGVTKASSNIQIKRFETSVRKYLEFTVPRLMLVLDPVKVIIDDLPDDHLEMVELPFAKDPAIGSREVPFTKVVYIERNDFREVDSPDYFRLAPGKTVGLMKAPYPITATTVQKDPATGIVHTVHAKYERPTDGSAPKKPKGWIHWVGSSSSRKSPIQARVRIISPLFKSENPASLDNFLSDINPDSQTYFPNAMIEVGFEEIRRRAPWPAQAGEKALVKPAPKDATSESAAGTGLEQKTTQRSTEEVANGDRPQLHMSQPEAVRFQGMRMGYFCMDKDGSEDQLVLNRIVSLKEDSGKD